MLLTSTFLMAVLASTALAQNFILSLSQDDSFKYKLLVTMAQATYGGADINDVLSMAAAIEPSNFSSWNRTFYNLALETQQRADQAAEKNQTNAMATYFAAANYWRNVDYYLHGNPEDPWINETWIHQKYNYDKALASFPTPTERLTLPTDGFDVYAIFYEAQASSNDKRPTIILGNGYDGSQEDIFFALGQPGIERGYNIITYEGPGQPSVRRNQTVGFIKDWGKVVSPVINYLHTRNDVDTSKIALVGFSFGGYLAEQAAAAEHSRLAALALHGGVYDIYEAFTGQLPDDLSAIYDSGNKTAFDSIVNAALVNDSTPTQLRWAVQQGMWSFNVDSPYDFLQHVKDWNFDGLAGNLTMPTWIANPDQDQFYAGQSPKVYQALRQVNDRVTLQNYTGTAGLHCCAGAYERLAMDLYGWLEEVLM